MSLPRYPKYKDSGVEWLGQVPEHWEVKRLAHLSEVIDPQPDHRAPALAENEEGFPYIGIRDLNGDGTVNTDTARLVKLDAVEKQESSFKIQDGDIVFCKVGTLGLPRLIRPISRIALSATLVLIKPHQNVHPLYLRYALDSTSLYQQIESLATGSTRQALGIEVIRKFALGIPPITEQQAIAQYLESHTTQIDRLVAEQEKLISLLNEKRQALISQAVTKGLDPHVRLKDSGVEWLGHVPEHWEVAPLKRGFEVRLGKMLQPNKASPSDELVSYLRAANIQWSGVDLTDLKQMWVSAEERQQLSLQPNDLLISEGGDVGRSALWKGELDNCYFQNSINRVRGHSSNSTQFLYYWLSMLKASGYIEMVCNKSTIAHFTAEKVSATPVALPPIAEQQAIVDFLESHTTQIDALVQEAQRGIELLKERRSALISAAVTGQIDVRGVVESVGL